MVTVVLGWLPVIDLPFPLVMIGGLILAIASNRMESSTSDGGKSPALSTQDPTSSSAVKGVEQSRQLGQQDNDALSTINSSSPSLPNVTPKRDRSISHLISSTVSPTQDSNEPPVSLKQQSASGAMKGDHAQPHSPAASSDPQLPSFTNPRRKKKKQVSFTIENQD